MFQIRYKVPGLWGGRKEPRSLKAFVQSLKHQGVFVDSMVSDWRAIALGHARLICSKQGGCNIRSFLRTSMLVQSSALLEAIGYSISLPILFASIRNDQCSNQLTERVTGGAQAQSAKSKENLSQTRRSWRSGWNPVWANAHRKCFSRSHMNTEGQTLLN